MEYKLCLACGVRFEKPKRFWSKKRWEARKYCGMTCVDRGRRATTNWESNIDKSGLEIGRKAPRSQAQKDSIASVHKGKFISTSYGAIHYWVRTTLGKPDKCEHCGDTEKLKHWSNKDHQYKKDKNDWQRLCVACHKQYDREHHYRD